MIKVDLSGAKGFFKGENPDYEAAARAHETLASGTGKGSDFRGWLELPSRMRSGELPRIIETAEKIKNRSKALVVIGIGGSYLGARAAINLLKPVPEENDVKVFFLGNGLSPDYLCDTLKQIGDDDFDVNVISKSGTTLEPAVSFRIFRELLKKKYGDKAGEHIFATTDKERGALKSLANSEGWETFVVPDDVGGRYSVLSAVGLLPMAVAGIDVSKVISFAEKALKDMDLRSPENPVWQYAAARQHLYRIGYETELLASFEPSFRFVGEWWKQLFGESEGKDGVGIFPASVEYTADLHSMGQFIQDGPRNLMETVVRFGSEAETYAVPFDEGNADGLNYLAGRDLGEIGKVVADAVRAAHVEGGVPNMVVEIPRRNEEGFAEMVIFFELACGVSGYMSGVNPFNQPGVEAYKKNMFKMLGKPGT